MNIFAFDADAFDRWIGTAPEYDMHDDLDLAAHNALLADLAEQDAHDIEMMIAMLDDLDLAAHNALQADLAEQDAHDLAMMIAALEAGQL